MAQEVAGPGLQAIRGLCAILLFVTVIDQLASNAMTYCLVFNSKQNIQVYHAISSFKFPLPLVAIVLLIVLLLVMLFLSVDMAAYLKLAEANPDEAIEPGALRLRSRSALIDGIKRLWSDVAVILILAVLILYLNPYEINLNVKYQETSLPLELLVKLVPLVLLGCLVFSTYSLILLLFSRLKRIRVWPTAFVVLCYSLALYAMVLIVDSTMPWTILIYPPLYSLARLNTGDLPVGIAVALAECLVLILIPGLSMLGFSRRNVPRAVGEPQP